MKHSAAQFDKCILIVNGILVWTAQPTVADGEDGDIGNRLFHCCWKDKFGML